MQTNVTQLIQQRIDAAGGPFQLTFIDLNGIDIRKIPQQAKTLLESCINLYEINLENCQLETLENIPNIKIETLVLSSNKINDEHLNSLLVYKDSLQVISLNDNNLQNIQSLQIFSSFDSLGQLDVKSNPFTTNNQNYSDTIFKDILRNNQKLTIIDRFCKNGQILSDEDFKDDQIDEDGVGFQNLVQQDLQNDNSNDQQLEGIIQENDEMSIIQKYAQAAKNCTDNNKPSFVVNYLNKYQTFNDPLDNCFNEDLKQVGIVDSQGEAMEQEDADQFKEEIQNNQFSFKPAKKVKIYQPAEYDDVDY